MPLDDSGRTPSAEDFADLRLALEQAQMKMGDHRDRSNHQERYWFDASHYDCFHSKFELHKLRKVLTRREATIVLRRPIHERTRSGDREKIMGVQMLVTRSGETFLHPGNTICEVALLPQSKGSSGAGKDERAFLVRYSDGSKTDVFEGSNYLAVMEHLRDVMGLSAQWGVMLPQTIEAGRQEVELKNLI